MKTLLKIALDALVGFASGMAIPSATHGDRLVILLAYVVSGGLLRRSRI